METRPPIPQGPPPSYAFVTRIYKRSLRPAVLVSAFCTALWCLLWALNAFRDIERDRDDNLPEYVPYDIALGSLFAGALAISIFTIFAAATQRIALVRMAKWLSVVEFIIVMGAQVLSIVLEFKFKGKLLDMCTTANTGDSVIIYHGWWGETRTSLSAKEARDWCNDLIRRDLIADFAWLVVTAVLGLLFLSVVFSFYRQLLDPNFSRAPSNQIRMQAFTVYAPAGPSQQPYGGPRYGEQDYVPPYDPQKLPDYQGAGRHTPEKDETFVPPAGPPPEPTTFTPPAGPPPGAPSSPRPTNPFVRRAEEP